MNPAQRRQFDELLDAIMDELPDDILDLLEEVPVIVEDEPSELLMRDMKLDRRHTELCGLHSGIPLTSRSVEHSATLPDRIMLFRGPIMRISGFGRGRSLRSLEQQIRTTLLHEIGHHFGLDEADLEELGYG